MKITTVQAAHSYGVLDPLVVERRDTKFVGSSLSDGDNIVLLPQGGYTDRGGTTDFGRARRAPAAVAIDGTILGLPNGGSETDLLAGDEITIEDAAGASFVLATLTFAEPTNLIFIDVAGIAIETTPADSALFAQYHDGTTWQPFGARARITLDARTRRLAAGGPGHAGFTATQFRVVLDATTAAGDVTLDGLRAWREGDAHGDGILRRYAPEQGMAHQLVITPGNIDVFEAGVWRAAIAFPATADNLRLIKFETRYDTILAFHVDMRPQQIRRLGASTEWSCDDVVFENVPLVDYGGVYTNGINEIQEIQTYDLAVGEQFDLAFEGQTTTAITIDADNAVNNAAVKAALEALPNVSPGLTVTNTGGTAWGAGIRQQVEFTGEGNANRDVLLMIGTALDQNGVVRVRTLRQGKAAGEAIMSDARGWPAVGRFAQQRLIMAGMKSQPNGVLASVTGQPFDLNTEVDVANAAFSYDVEFSENSTILDMIAARTLIFFGDQQVAYLKNRVLSATEVPEFGVSDAPGIRAETVATSSDNAIFYIQDGGATLRTMTYTELEQNFVSDNASVLSAHLIRSPIEIVRRRPVGKVNSDLLIMINEDGTATVLTVMRTQEVSGFAPWSTDGAFRSAAVDHDNILWLLVERQVDGATQLRFERADPEKLLDEALDIAIIPGTEQLTGLARFNGRAVWLIGDQDVFGPYTISGGVLPLPRQIGQARVGTWRPPLAVDPAVSLEEEAQARRPRLKRVNRAVLSIIDTTSVAIAANGGPLINLPLRSNADTITDTPVLSVPVTGTVEAEGMHGFTREGKLTVTQQFPGRLTVRSLTKNVAA
jgi:hypothetical protein